LGLGGAADGMDHSPHRPEENPGGDGEGQAGEKEAGGNGVEAHKTQGAECAIPLDQLPELVLIKILVKVHGPRANDGADKQKEN
jgi:hypothetical protein